MAQTLCRHCADTAQTLHAAQQVRRLEDAAIVDLLYVRTVAHFQTLSVAESMWHTATGQHKTWKGLGMKRS
jgi:hypothetical protein